eukprot:CAMPEP_0171319888 /NCGR_PEP_ID=MMETSP0816-20121228/99978_1 /TAXON_ID=420281 /ORGANISM="Proboscia inermis, Strain CCAP1064/1" /LENGTH=60 /DNA_ID=CAMNT_0011816077 /DNA_START=89 /DNA_END=268 /DNA_ORIENTATION=+
MENETPARGMGRDDQIPKVVLRTGTVGTNLARGTGIIFIVALKTGTCHDQNEVLAEQSSG